MLPSLHAVAIAVAWHTPGMPMMLAAILVSGLAAQLPPPVVSGEPSSRSANKYAPLGLGDTDGRASPTSRVPTVMTTCTLNTPREP
jgi:hypothetical protein